MSRCPRINPPWHGLLPLALCPRLRLRLLCKQDSVTNIDNDMQNHVLLITLGGRESLVLAPELGSASKMKMRNPHLPLSMRKKSI
jgi:hypothetical protein